MPRIKPQSSDSSSFYIHHISLQLKRRFIFKERTGEIPSSYFCPAPNSRPEFREAISLTKLWRTSVEGQQCFVLMCSSLHPISVFFCQCPAQNLDST